MSILAYIYFFYSIFSLVFNLLKFTDYKEEALSFQLNEFILKRHLLCLIKSSDFFTLILILIFIIFKIKILVKILFFKYIGLFCCLPILYAQWVLYKKIMYKYHMIIEIFVFTFNVNTLDMYIKKEYLEFKRLTYPVFFIVILECFSLILLNKS